jgi:hypothetical protein
MAVSDETLEPNATTQPALYDDDENDEASERAETGNSQSHQANPVEAHTITMSLDGHIGVFSRGSESPLR